MKSSDDDAEVTTMRVGLKGMHEEDVELCLRSTRVHGLLAYSQKYPMVHAATASSNAGQPVG